ncbi:MAG: hypothetical protein ACRD2C_18040 [Acidimicrobiales bacterium]
MRSLRWWSLLLVPGGFVAGHEAGYEAARLLGAPAFTGGGQHDYLRSVVMVGVPFLFAAVARHLLAGIRDELPRARFGTLAIAQSTVFLAFELVEHAQVGMAPTETLRQPAVVLGLIAQVAAAAFLHLIARASHRIAAAVIRGRPALRLVTRPSWAVVAIAAAAVAIPASSLSRRGPPLSPQTFG